MIFTAGQNLTRSLRRVMYGEIEVVSYDWAKQEEQSKEYGQPKPARLVLDKSVKVRLQLLLFSRPEIPHSDVHSLGSLRPRELTWKDSF